jgi:hypothetical protein
MYKMTTTTQCATYIIDLSDAMLNHRQGLSAQQIAHLETINRRTVEFVTEFLLHENSDLDTLFNFLSFQAIQPISIIIGFSEYMLIGGTESMLPVYREAIEEICDCGYSLRDDMQLMLEELVDFMDSIGYEHADVRQIPQTTQTSTIKPIQALAPKEEITDIPRKPAQSFAPKEEITDVPRKPIQALAPKEDITEVPRKPIQALAPKAAPKPIQRLQPR